MPTPKILLVDDTKLFLELEKNFLRLSPVRILTAASGEEALEIARRELPNLIFMDITMPGMGGIACCSAIKSDERLRSIPVIMVSARGKEEDLEACRKAGCDGFLTKPVDRKLFLEKTRSFLAAAERKDTRVACDAPLTFTVDGVSWSGMGADISYGGIYVASDGNVEEQTTVSLNISLSKTTEEPVTARGVVAWKNGPTQKKKPSLPAGFGIEFTDLTEIGDKKVRSFVDTMRKNA